MHATVLCVDDSEDDLLLLRLAFDKASTDCQLLTLQRGEHAVDYLAGKGPYADRAQFPIPALMLLDIRMPGMSGFDVLAWVRSRPEFSSLPIVMLTSSSLESDMKTASVLGASDYRIKPVQHQSLVAIVQEVCSRWTETVIPTTGKDESCVKGADVEVGVPVGERGMEVHQL